MVRKNPPEPLATQTNSANANVSRGPQSATMSPTSPRAMFARTHSKSSENIQHSKQGFGNNVPHPPYPETSMMPKSVDFEMSQQQLEQPMVNTPPAAEHSPHKSGFFGFGKSKSSNKLQQKDERRPATRDQLQSNDNNLQLQSNATVADMNADNKMRDVRPQTSDRTLQSDKTEPFPSYKDASSESGSIQHNQHNQLQNTSSNFVPQKKNKPKAFAILRRTNSTRNEFDGQERSEPTTQEQEYQEGVRTAPLREEQDPNFRETLRDSQSRNQSADRQRYAPEQQFNKRMKEHRPNQGSVSLPREGASSLMNHIKGAGSKAQGLFGRGKSKRDDPVEVFVPKIVNQPLIEQTRNTRISKRLETSRDKTEFWMPSLPWRCIDYLNYRGTDQEGLYRVPGGTFEIKKYHKKFDEELDVDLFQERDLYDINVIGSLLKQWLRELPDELFPKESQIRVARAAGQEPTEVPQVLIDELSNLPPYNYYLLFALTCHLSLILEHQDKNKMTMHNITVCLLPCMKMDNVCFRLLVEHWRDCWKGCLTEGEWMDKENKWREGEAADLRAPGPLGMRKGSVAQGSTHERNLSSNSDSRPATGIASNERSRNVSRENNNPNAHNLDTRQGSNGNGNCHNIELRDRNINNNNCRDNSNNSNSSSRERQLTYPTQPSSSRGGGGGGGLRGGACEPSSSGDSRLQTPPEIYVPVGNHLLDPIQPMSPMHMPSANRG